MKVKKAVLKMSHWFSILTINAYFEKITVKKKKKLYY